MKVTVKGIAFRQGGDDHEFLGPLVHVPAVVVCTVNFDLTRPLGRAKLSHDDEGNLWAEVDVTKNAELLPLYPVLGISLRSPAVHPVADQRIIESGAVVGLSICSDNNDHSIPPYDVTYDEGGKE